MNEIIEKEIKIENMIYEIRGKQVMLDSDLAKLYKCKNGTKVINQAVNRNIDRFPSDFYFQLTQLEYNNLQSQFVTANRNMSRTLPYAFTEQGVAMLATVLRTSVASKVSVSIMRAFVVMRHFVGNNLIEQKLINNVVLENKEKISIIEKDVKLLQELFDKLEGIRKDSGIYFNGQIYDAYSKILNIFKEAEKDLIIIDNYADNTVLDIVKRLKVKVLLITRKNNLLTQQDIQKYNKQYSNLTVIYDNSYHDRYFILDSEFVYHCGASINRIGYKTFSINLLGDKDIVKSLLSKINNIII